MKLSKNFSIQEFACKDGSQDIIVDYELILKLQALRELIDKPILISSGYRTESYNKECSGIKTSLHLRGMAADIKVSGMTPHTVALWADRIGFKGIGVYPTFTHVDVGGSSTGAKIYWKQNVSGVKTFIKSLADAK
jgi:uncharacterized protein YcbK (DUF882 family)